jgi:hypothetical protein
MRLTFTNNLLLLLLLISASVSYAQEERINQSQDDSLLVVVPIAEPADLLMITPPQGFEESTIFNGYLSIYTSTAIQMQMIRNVVFPKLLEGMNEEWAARYSMTKISDTILVTDAGFKGHMYKYTYYDAEMKYQAIRYVVYIGDMKDTIWLNIVYPESVEALVEDEILKSLKTVNLKPE